VLHASSGARRTSHSAQPQLEFTLPAPRKSAQAAPDRPAQENDRPMTDDSDDDDSPVFALVKESGIDGVKRTLYLVLETTQGELFRLDFTPGCVPLAVAALSAELGFLQRQQADSAMPVQPIIADACQLGETADGSPVLIATMEGGGELPLQASLKTLQRLAKDIEAYMRAKAPGPARP